MDNVKQVVILAGGFGTRLRTVVNNVPKPLSEVKGKPFLSWLMDYLIVSGFEKAVLSVGYMKEKIEDYYADSYNGLKILYAEESTPLGTGGGILNALQQINTDTFAVVNGDTMFKVDFSALEKLHFENKSDLTLAVRQIEDVSRYGSVEKNTNNQITHFNEKGTKQGIGLINGGIYIMNKELFSNFHTGDNFSFEKDIMEKEYLNKRFFAYESNAYFIDIGVPEDYFRANKEF